MNQKGSQNNKILAVIGSFKCNKYANKMELFNRYTKLESYGN